MSAQDLYPFDDPSLAKTFANLSAEVRCLVCQNQSIADSNAPLAQDLRHKIYELLKGGQDQHQIKSFLVHHYGDYVLFKPPVQGSTWVLWGLPVLLVIGALCIVGWMQRRSLKSNEAAS